MQRHVNTKLYPMFRSLEGFVLGEHELLRQAGKEAVGQGDDVGGCHISTNSFRNLSFLLEALETEKCPHRAEAAAVPGWPKQGDSVGPVLGCVLMLWMSACWALSATLP